MEKIERWSAGIRMKVIEFGPGGEAEKGSFLKELARRVGGEYAYVDTTKFSASKAKSGTADRP